MAGAVAHLAPSGAPPEGQNTDTRFSLASQLTSPSAWTDLMEALAGPGSPFAPGAPAVPVVLGDPVALADLVVLEGRARLASPGRLAARRVLGGQDLISVLDPVHTQRGSPSRQ